MNDFDKFNPLIDPVKEAALAEMKKKALLREKFRH
ncbi:MAG: hypothetical protein G01um101448_1093 [Parcubacteria group bacterium Gr01-1014_48]|nr:MAG: hypothetical protein G01um101448_1093 [Parcubacteria group bacterium Gr01-1014_48]